MKGAIQGNIHHRLQNVIHQLRVWRHFTHQDSEDRSKAAKEALKMFETHVPIQMEVPGEKYTGQKQPWLVEPDLYD